MKKAARIFLGIMLGLFGVGLLYLTNQGILSFRQPIIRDLSAELPPIGATAFVNIHVLTMENDQILPRHTVIVRDGRIQAMGPDLTVPTDAQIVRGDGRFLMPGLADMHVHIKEENELLLFVANGVTTVRDMWGTTGMQLALGFPDQLDLRRQINSQSLLGPRIFTAGPIMEGSPPTTPLMPVFESPQAARESVTWQANAGYDFIKVYDNLSPEVYQTILQTAEKHQLPVVGHVPHQVGLGSALAHGQHTIEHLSGYIDPDTLEWLIPEQDLAAWAEQTQEAGVWNCVTLGVYTKNLPPEQLSELENQAGITAVSPRMKALWHLLLPQLVSGEYGAAYPAQISRLNQQMVQALHAAGAGILLGTDTDNPFLVPGFSLLDELELLAAAGLTPYEALAAGTTNAALALGREEEFGTIAPGKRADFLVLAANPLVDIANVRQQLGVMVNGRWLPREQLESMLEAVSSSYRPTLFERLWPLAFLLAAWLLVRRPRN